MIDLEKILSEMSLKEKIYQTMIPRSKDYLYDEATAEEKISECQVGGFFVGAEIIDKVRMTGERVIEAIGRANKYLKIPPIICADTESGCGYLDERFPHFPRQMTLGATYDKELAYEYGKYTALAAKKIGVNLSLGPVSDINFNFHNSITGTRAIGDDPELVREMVAAEVRGMQEHGMGATAKHFPGDGMDYRDQHYVVTNNSLSVEEWKKTYGAIYKTLIDEGLLCVMAGHISFSAYQKERVDGMPLPATLSKELMTDLLKGELGFKYAIMSDALVMRGFRTTYADQIKSEIECFKAGCDLMLWPCAEYAEAMENAVNSGEVSVERLDDAVMRILLLKKELGLFGDKEFKTDSVEKSFDVANKVAEKSVTLIRDRKNILPCKTAKKVAIVSVRAYDDEHESLKYMKEEFIKNGVDAEVYKDICKKDFADCDLIIYCTFATNHKPLGLQVWPDWSVGTMFKEKSVVVALGSPYVVNCNFADIHAAIAVYTNDAQSQRAAVNAIVGNISFLGKLPVKLPDYM